MKKAPVSTVMPSGPAIGCWLFALVVALYLHGNTGFARAAESYVQHMTKVLESPPAGTAYAEAVEEAILADLNAYRAKKGRKPLPMAGQRLRDAARVQAMDLLIKGEVGHVAATGHSFESRMRLVLGGKVPVMAENAARDRRKGLGDAEKASGLVAQWIKSLKHRKSLTDLSYVSVAIGAVRRGDEVYAVQIFAGPGIKTGTGANPAASPEEGEGGGLY